MCRAKIYDHYVSINRLAGYIPSGEALAAVNEVATKLRQTNPELIYLLDRMSLQVPWLRPTVSCVLEVPRWRC